MTAPADLSGILTPELYAAVLNHHFPFPISKPLDWTVAPQFYFGGNSPERRDAIYALLHEPVLKSLSQHRTNFPDLMAYLPPPEADAFPSSVVALILILDQGPRACYRGFDWRWTHGFFDIHARKLLLQCLDLPAAVRPDNIDRWTTLGYPLEHTLLRLLWLYAPLGHSEVLSEQLLGQDKTETMRRAVDDQLGETDPHRATPQDETNLLLFRDVYRSGPPEGFREFWWWMCRVSDAHAPIIRVFGRSPIRNAVLGRESTQAEEKYLEDTAGIGPRFSAQDAQVFRGLVERDEWPPLVGRG